MAAPSSTSSSMDTITAPLAATTTAFSSNALRPYPSSSISPPHLSLPIAAHLFSAQPLPPPPPPQGITYQIPPPSRGLLRRTSVRTPSSGQIVTVANPAGYIRNNSPTAILTYPAAQARPYVFPYDYTAQVQQPQVHLMRPPLQAQLAPQPVVPRQFGSCGVRSGPLPKNALAATQTKVTPFSTGSSAAVHNNYIDLRDRSRDDAVIVVKDRKVRLLDSGSDSFYSLCRSWVQNGTRQESQSNFGDGVKLLPRPFTATVTNSTKTNKNGDIEDDENPEKEEHAGDVRHLSTRDLLDRHLKRSKRIRARFKEERRRRIGRYKQRLSLLFPTPEEQPRNEAAPGS